MKKPLFRRLLAYLFDVFIISIISTAIARISFLNPYLEEYTEAEAKYEAIIESVAEDSTKANELINSDEIVDITYDITKTGVYISIYSLVLTFGYFAGFQYYTKGKTLGKLLAKIEVVSNDKEELKFSQLCKRTIINNNIITTSLICILVLVLSKKNYLSIGNYISLIETTITLLSIGFVIYREDGRGLHDLFGGTRVIYSEDKDFFLRHEEVKDAIIVDEESKVETKKTTNKKNIKAKKKDE
jgi:uncharacterized RDD family membrane protein YckC